MKFKWTSEVLRVLPADVQQVFIYPSIQSPMDSDTCCDFLVFVYFLAESKWPFIFCPCHMACGILVPWPGIEPESPALEVQSPNHWTTRKVSLILVEGRKLSLSVTYFYFVIVIIREKDHKTHEVIIKEIWTDWVHEDDESCKSNWRNIPFPVPSRN